MLNAKRGVRSDERIGASKPATDPFEQPRLPRLGRSFGIDDVDAHLVRLEIPEDLEPFAMSRLDSFGKRVLQVLVRFRDVGKRFGQDEPPLVVGVIGPRDRPHAGLFQQRHQALKVRRRDGIFVFRRFVEKVAKHADVQRTLTVAFGRYLGLLEKGALCKDAVAANAKADRE